MKKIFSLIILILFIISVKTSNSQFVLQYKFLDANSINAIFWNSGIFDQDPRTQNTPGFEWPKGSNKHAIFTAGINLSARVNGMIRQAVCSYKGEYVPGYCSDSIPVTNGNFKIYKVSRGDNQNTNPDWANWGLMVPYGAPFIDVNHNGIYEPAIDTPGVKNAASTIFICLTDGFTSSHNSGEGFGGGTLPLFAEVHMTAWAYTISGMEDMQFIKYEIINKGKKPWNGLYFSIVSDPDLGDPNDDYIGCDTVKRIGICYNFDNNDGVYGVAPPAVGIMFLKGMINKSVVPNINLGMTSFGFFSNVTASGPPCESDPSDPRGAYLYMKGYKNDSSSWLDVTQPFNGNHYKRTKFCYYGGVEENSGWTENKGKINNCDLGRTDTGTISHPNPPGDRRFVMSSGAENFTFNVGDTQIVYLCQLIARGTNNLNSVSKLMQYATTAQIFYNTEISINVKQISSIVPDKYELYQNYPNPFNPSTNIKFSIPTNVKNEMSNIKLIVYNILGKEIKTLVNEKLNAGTYEVQFSGDEFPSGIYFYSLRTDDFAATNKMVMIK